MPRVEVAYNAACWHAPTRADLRRDDIAPRRDDIEYDPNVTPLLTHSHTHAHTHPHTHTHTHTFSHTCLRML